jgi:phenylalanyl-tRNA synthetase beta chain
MRSRPEAQRTLHDLRDRLAAADYQEVVNFSFVDEGWEQDFSGNADPIRLLNPIAQQLSVMRTCLVGGLVSTVRYNLNRKASRVRLFEVGRVFLKQGAAGEGPVEVAGIRQPTRIGGIAFGPAEEDQWGVRARGVDFYDVKADVESLAFPRQLRFEAAANPALHPGRSARIVLDDAAIGWLGEIHPRWLQKYELPAAAIAFELEAEPLCQIGVPSYRELSRFQPVLRDLAFVVDERVSAQSMLDVMLTPRPPALEQVRLFDVYQGPGLEKGEKSLAFRVLLQDTQKTLTDSDVESVMAEMCVRLEQRFGARLRK